MEVDVGFAMSDAPQSPTPQGIQVNVHPAALVTQLRSRLRETTNRTIICLAALAHLPDGEELLPHTGAFMHVTFGEPPSSSQQSRDDCRAWLTGLALREGVDGLSLLCEEIWRLVSIVSKLALGPVKVTAPLSHAEPDLIAIANAVFGKPTKGIDHGGLGDKLAALRKEFGIALTWESELQSINQARNCLTHRLGVVGEKDLNDKGNEELVVRYRSHELSVTTPDGKTEALAGPKYFDNGGSVALHFGVEHERRFKRGGRVVFTAQEVMHLMMTFKFAGDELVQQATASIARASASAPTMPERPDPSQGELTK